MLRTGINVGWAAALSVALAITIGCDGGSTNPTVKVSGKVTIGGKPVPSDADARITFRPTAAGQANSVQATIKDGTYEITNAPKGSVQVYFHIMRPTGEMKSFDGVARPEPVQQDLVPTGKSMQQITIDTDKTDQNFDL